VQHGRRGHQRSAAATAAQHMDCDVMLIASRACCATRRQRQCEREPNGLGVQQQLARGCCLLYASTVQSSALAQQPAWTI
jgi:hypothetical protein